MLIYEMSLATYGSWVGAGAPRPYKPSFHSFRPDSYEMTSEVMI